ncbi:Uncharacterised protein [Streptococcus pneumoniae]|nr:Uncharacterised protein [Streptococcus pneumoniae]
MRVDAGQQEGLAAVDVADPGDEPLVEQGQADRPLGPGREPPHALGEQRGAVVGRVPGRVQQVGAEVAEDGGLVGGGHEGEQAQLGAEHAVLRRLQHRPHLPGGGTPPRVEGGDEPAPLHLQVRDQGERPGPGAGRGRGQPHQQVLGARQDLGHRPAGQVRGGVAGHAQIRVRQGPALEHGAEPMRDADEGVAFRHGPSPAQAALSCQVTPKRSPTHAKRREKPSSSGGM